MCVQKFFYISSKISLSRGVEDVLNQSNHVFVVFSANILKVSKQSNYSLQSQEDLLWAFPPSAFIVLDATRAALHDVQFSFSPCSPLLYLLYEK